MLDTGAAPVIPPSLIERFPDLKVKCIDSNGTLYSYSGAK